MENRIIDYITQGKDGEKRLVIIDTLTKDIDYSAHLYQIKHRVELCIIIIESGKLEKYFPSVNNGYRICILCKYDIDDQSRTFLERTKTIVESRGIDFEYSHYEDSYSIFEYKDL